MAILGHNTKGVSVRTILDGKDVSKYTLAAAATLTELHGWFSAGTIGTALVVVYADSSGSPGARVAFTSPFAPTGADIERVQTGFFVPLAAGDYWIGFAAGVTTDIGCFSDAGGTYKGITSGVAGSPPSDPFGTTNRSGASSYSCWAVTDGATVAPVADFTGTPTSGPAPLSVSFSDASTNTPASWAWDFGD